MASNEEHRQLEIADALDTAYEALETAHTANGRIRWYDLNPD